MSHGQAPQRRTHQTASRRPAGDAGSALLEVLVGSVVIFVVLGAVLMSMDVGASINRVHQRRAVAADLAQQDQERMRAIPMTQLSNLRQTRTVTVDGATFTVASRADWVRDASGAVGCTADPTGSQYLSLTSTVTWPDQGPQPAVTMRGLATPTAGVFGVTDGTAAVQVVDRTGAPLSGISVGLSGPASASDSTDANGCTVFGNVPGGTYALTATAPGRVDVAGNSTLTMNAAVVPQVTTLFTAPYDRPATATISFDKKVGSSFVPAQAQAVTVTAAGLPAPGTRTFVPPTVPAATATIGSLYPFTGGYTAYAGDCPSADPRNAPTSNPTYFATNPGQLTTAPGGTPSVTVHMPAINVVVRNASNQILTNARVRVTATGAGCGTFPIQLTNSAGALPIPEYPFGAYTLCADDGNRRRVTGVAVSNTNVNGTASTLLRLSSSQTSNCP